MQKFGRVIFQSTKATYNFVWYENSLDFERLDVIEDFSNYNTIDTSSCVAAYYRKNKEMFYGNEDIVKSILKTRHSASLFKAKQEQTVEIKDGAVFITQVKEDTNIGMKYKLVTKNGLIDYEYYETPEAIVEILEVDKNKGSDIPPINLSDYYTFNVAGDVVESAGGDAEYYSLDYLRAKYPIAHIDDNDFVVVESIEEARERLERFRNAPTKIKAVDLETTGTETGMYGPDVITGIVLSYDEDESTYYPFRQDKCDFNLPLQFMADILDAINNQPDDVVIVAHNGKFEIQGVWKEEPCYLKYSPYPGKYDPQYLENAIKNTFLRIDRDSFILSTLINPKMGKGLHSLKSLVFRITGLFYLELDDIFKGEIRFNALPPEIIRVYACPDTPNTIKVYKYLMTKIPKDEIPLFELECKLVYVKACNEFYGMRTNKQLLVESIENEEYKVKTLGDYFRRAHKTSKNINSNDVRRDIFYNRLRCPVEVRTTTGQPSTSAIALQRIVDLGTLREYNKDKIPPPILDLNKKVIVKGEELASNRYPSLVVLNKYSKSMKELGALRRIQRKSLRDRVMFGINQTGAGSGRQTSDAHQYSDTMKSLICADSEDHYMWSADFKQIELRVLAYLAQQKNLIELESNQDIDIHRAILSIITGKEIWSITAKERKKGKSVNFGVVYMMSEFGLAKKEAGPAYTKEDLVNALKSINGFYNGLPMIKKFVKGNEEFVKKNGFIKTRFNRYRYFPEILEPGLPENIVQSKVRAANNTPVQGFAADYMKIVEVNLWEYIKSKGWDEKVDCNGVMLPKVRLMLSIHDEVLVSTHKSIPIEEIIIMFKTCMEINIEGAPPFFAAPAMVNNWLDGKNDAFEIDLPFRDKIIEAWNKDHTSLLHPDTYLEDLNKFRSGRLKEYMDDLITKYKTVDEVANHVRHPELTHTLLAVEIKKTEKFEHLEAIHVAVERYMEQNKVDSDALITALAEKTEEEKADEKGLTDFEELEEYIEFDENGEAIVEEPEEGTEEDDLSTLKDYRPNDFDKVERSYCTFMLNDVIIDLSDFDIHEEGELMNQAIGKLSSPNNYYRVVYFMKGRLVRTDLKIDYIPDEINKIIRKYSNKETSVKGELHAG